MHKRASIVVDQQGAKVEIGYKSEIIGITLKNDIQKARGKRGKLILWEEAGKFPGLKEAWQIARPSVEQDGVAYGLMIAFGCVCAGTKIWINNGDLINIEDLKQKYGIVGYNTYSAIPQEVSHFREPYETECYRITTNSGKTIECSHDHPIVFSKCTMSKRVPGKRKTNEHMKSWKWKEASKFEVNDQVGVIEDVPIFGDKEMWNPRLIGWLIGDGTYGKDKTPRLSNCEEEINNYIDSNFNTITEKQYITKEGKLYKETRLKDICFRLRELGIYGQVKENKKLPNLIFQCKKEDVCELLGGLFDTDGYISDLGKTNRNYINITSAYKELLISISFLLQKIGVHGKLSFVKPNPKNSKDKNGYYRLDIRDIKSLKAFANNITFFPKEKQRRLEEYKALLNNKFGETSKYIHGIRFEKVIKIEPIGLQKVYNITAEDTHTYIANGIITHNTGGTEEGDYESLEQLFYEPTAYNCLEIDNVWDEGATKKCGFFVPEYMNMKYTKEEDGEASIPLMDADGNSFINLAKTYCLKERRKVFDNASDKNSIDRYVAEHPFTPAEACLRIAGNIFPKTELTKHLAYIRNHESIKNFKQVGELYFDTNGLVKWDQQKKLKDITSYKLDPKDSTVGAVVIWEHPCDDPPYGLYIMSVDPYRHDKSSSSNSLGSCLVYKRFQTFEKTHDLIVAEYTARPETLEEFYENIRKLALYYKATILYENEVKGLFQHFEHKHCEYLMADQPGIIKDIIKDSKVQRGKGIHMVTGIKDWAELKLKDWLCEEYEPGKKNLTKILSEPLLEELIAYNDEGNFDRVIAFMLIMIYNAELHRVHVKRKEDVSKRRSLFDEPLFSSYYEEIVFV